MSRIYALSKGEDGGTDGDLVATADKANVERMLTETWPTNGRWNFDKELAVIRDLLAKDEPGSHDISGGWGGWQLHIVDLYEPS